MSANPLGALKVTTRIVDMADSATLAIVGAVTGIVGTITGLAGFVLGYISYRRSHQIKALDLRLELRTRLSDLRALVEELPDLLQRSELSRSRVLSATGLLRTGAYEAWKATLASDLAHARTLAGELPNAADDYYGATHRELESKLVEVHALASKAARLRDKYHAELAADDRERENIKADQRVRTQAMRERE